MTYPLVRELAVDGIPVAVTCRMLKLVRQRCYRWLTAPVGQRELAEVHLANAFDARRSWADARSGVGSKTSSLKARAPRGNLCECGLLRLSLASSVVRRRQPVLDLVRSDVVAYLWPRHSSPRAQRLADASTSPRGGRRQRRGGSSRPSSRTRTPIRSYACLLSESGCMGGVVPCAVESEGGSGMLERVLPQIGRGRRRSRCRGLAQVKFGSRGW